MIFTVNNTNMSITIIIISFNIIIFNTNMRIDTQTKKTNISALLINNVTYQGFLGDLE